MSARLMTNRTGGNDERLMELLAGETLGDLSTDEQRELDVMASALSDADRSCMEHAAAALALMTPEPEAMPESLAQRLLDDVHSAPLAGPGVFVESKANTNRDREDTNPSFLALSGWLAAAAALVAAFVIAVTQPKPVESLSADQQLAAFLDNRPADAVEIDWTTPMPDDPSVMPGLNGQVVWSDERQEGYMVFEGLAANDPTVEQYQLWIFDTERPDATPVDGGVFDIAGGQARVVIPIASKIQVFSAAAFAVTIEAPGGVVVSERQRIPVLAAVPASS